jgi:hypothetical protein
VGLAGDGSGEQGLAGAWGADHEDALGADRAGAAVAVGVLEEVDHLGDLALGALVAGHVGEGRLGPLHVEHLGPGPADPTQATHPGQLPARRAARPHEQP